MSWWGNSSSQKALEGHSLLLGRNLRDLRTLGDGPSGFWGLFISYHRGWSHYTYDIQHGWNLRLFKKNCFFAENHKNIAFERFLVFGCFWWCWRKSCIYPGVDVNFWPVSQHWVALSCLCCQFHFVFTHKTIGSNLSHLVMSQCSSQMKLELKRLNSTLDTWSWECRPKRMTLFCKAGLSDLMIGD